MVHGKHNRLDPPFFTKLMAIQCAILIAYPKCVQKIHILAQLIHRESLKSGVHENSSNLDIFKDAQEKRLKSKWKLIWNAL